MIDLKVLRKDPEPLREALSRRNPELATFLDRILETERARLEGQQKAEDARSRANRTASEIGKAFQSGDRAKAEELKKEAASLKASLKEIEAGLDELEEKVKRAVLEIPNPPHSTVPAGRSEADNRVVRKGSAEPKAFDFEAKDHQAIGEALGILDFETAGRLAGSRFVVLRGPGARLERALAQFMLEKHLAKGYEEIAPPLLLKPEVLVGTGQLPKFEEDQYKTGEEPEEKFLLPTAEVPLTNFFGNTILEEETLPKNFVAHTPCFRREAGSYGKDTRGMIRQHQFNKVELVWFTKPEDSLDTLETLTRDAESVVEALGLPYRVVELCAGDLGFCAMKTYDIEVWFPSQKKYREISSCSNCGDFQARRIGTRFRREGRPEWVHTLNGSGVAVGRLAAALLENGQRQDGSVETPEALRPYMGGATEISK